MKNKKGPDKEDLAVDRYANPFRHIVQLTKVGLNISGFSLHCFTGSGRVVDGLRKKHSLKTEQ